MTQFYYNSKPIPQGVAINRLANWLGDNQVHRVRSIVQGALMGNKQDIKTLADYGLSIGGV